MNSTFSPIGMPGALELLVIAVIVGAVILIIGPKKARAALGVVLAIAVGLGLISFMALHLDARVSHAPTSTIRSTVEPMSVAIEAGNGSAAMRIMPILGSTEPSIPPSPYMSVPPTPQPSISPGPYPSVPSSTNAPILPTLEIPPIPSPEGFPYAPAPPSAMGNTRMKVAILPLVILLAIIAGLVALVLRSRRPGRIVVGVLAGVAILLFLGMVVFRFRSSPDYAQLHESVHEGLRLDGVTTMREQASRQAAAIRDDARAKANAMHEQASREVDRVRDQIARSRSNSTDSTTAAEWTPSDQHAFEADLYPSKQSAAVALARHSLDLCLTELMPNDILRVVHLSVSEDLNGAILDRMTDRITQQVNLARTTGFKTLPPQAPLRVTVDSVYATATAPADSPPAAPGELTLRFVTIKDLPADQSANNDQAGEIQLTLRSQDGERVRVARFVNAPWTEGFSKWTQQGAGTWVLGESDQLWPTGDQARADAFQRAAEGIERHLRDYIARNGRYTPVSAFVERPGWLISQIASELRSGRLGKSEFNQSFNRPYGTVYRHAVLVSLPPERLQALAGQYFRHVDQVRDTWGRSIGSSLALLALVFVVYLVLNAATRGYYVWVMRTAAVMAAVVGVFLVYLFAASTN